MVAENVLSIMIKYFQEHCRILQQPTEVSSKVMGGGGDEGIKLPTEVCGDDWQPLKSREQQRSGSWGRRRPTAVSIKSLSVLVRWAPDAWWCVSVCWGDVEWVKLQSFSGSSGLTSDIWFRIWCNKQRILQLRSKWNKECSVVFPFFGLKIISKFGNLAVFLVVETGTEMQLSWYTVYWSTHLHVSIQPSSHSATHRPSPSHTQTVHHPTNACTHTNQWWNTDA